MLENCFIKLISYPKVMLIAEQFSDFTENKKMIMIDQSGINLACQIPDVGHFSQQKSPLNVTSVM